MTIRKPILVYEKLLLESPLLSVTQRIAEGTCRAQSDPVRNSRAFAHVLEILKDMEPPGALF